MDRVEEADRRRRAPGQWQGRPRGGYRPLQEGDERENMAANEEEGGGDGAWVEGSLLEELFRERGRSLRLLGYGQKKVTVAIILVNFEIKIIQMIYWGRKHDAFIQRFSRKIKTL